MPNFNPKTNQSRVGGRFGGSKQAKPSTTANRDEPGIAGPDEASKPHSFERKQDLISDAARAKPRLPSGRFAKPTDESAIRPRFSKPYVPSRGEQGRFVPSTGAAGKSQVYIESRKVRDFERLAKLGTVDSTQAGAANSSPTIDPTVTPAPCSPTQRIRVPIFVQSPFLYFHYIGDLEDLDADSPSTGIDGKKQAMEVTAMGENSGDEGSHGNGDEIDKLFDALYDKNEIGKIPRIPAWLKHSKKRQEMKWLKQQEFNVEGNCTTSLSAFLHPPPSPQQPWINDKSRVEKVKRLFSKFVTTHPDDLPATAKSLPMFRRYGEEGGVKDHIYTPTLFLLDDADNDHDGHWRIVSTGELKTDGLDHFSLYRAVCNAIKWGDEEYDHVKLRKSAADWLRLCKDFEWAAERDLFTKLSVPPNADDWEKGGLGEWGEREVTPAEYALSMLSDNHYPRAEEIFLLSQYLGINIVQLEWTGKVVGTRYGSVYKESNFIPVQRYPDPFHARNKSPHEGTYAIEAGSFDDFTAPTLFLRVERPCDENGRTYSQGSFHLAKVHVVVAFYQQFVGDASGPIPAPPFTPLIDVADEEFNQVKSTTHVGEEESSEDGSETARLLKLIAEGEEQAKADKQQTEALQRALEKDKAEFAANRARRLLEEEELKKKTASIRIEDEDMNAV